MLFARAGADTWAPAMAERGREFVEEHLKMRDVRCYWKNLLMKYAEKMDFKPVHRDDVMEIKK